MIGHNNIVKYLDNTLTIVNLLLTPTNVRKKYPFKANNYLKQKVRFKLRSMFVSLVIIYQNDLAI